MTTSFYRWWIIDEVTGERFLTPYKLTRAHAALAFPGAEPELHTLEARELPDLGQGAWSNTRPGEPWEDSLPNATTPTLMPSLGEWLTLPSGLVVKSTVQALLRRPWVPIKIASVWYVRGDQGPRNHSAFFVDPKRPGWPLELDEIDAIALARILNHIR